MSYGTYTTGIVEDPNDCRRWAAKYINNTMTEMNSLLLLSFDIECTDIFNTFLSLNLFFGNNQRNKQNRLL